jgi:hypothetical protein
MIDDRSRMRAMNRRCCTASVRIESDLLTAAVGLHAAMRALLLLAEGRLQFSRGNPD